tara:strand:- start:2725 stop:3039 length:315 start_codon:yes stop_codon:yes gene_type:complete
MEFNDYHRDILQQVAREEDEVFYEMRKGIAQNKYIMEIPEGSTYFSSKKYEELKVPSYLIGFWMMEYADNLQYERLDESIMSRSWVKCEAKEILTKTWEEIKNV